MRVNGQRWDFEIGNSTVTVENAYVWYGYSQERVRLNDEVVFDRKGWGFVVTSAILLTEIELLERTYGVTVGLTMQNQKPVVFCRLITETDVIEPIEVWRAKWSTNEFIWPADPDPLQLDDTRTIWQRKSE